MKVRALNPEHGAPGSMGIALDCVIGKSAILRGHLGGGACGGGHQPSSNKGRLVFRKEGRIGHIIVFDDKGES